MRPHKTFTFCLIVSIVISLSINTYGQSKSDFVTAHVLYNDSTEKNLTINEYQFIKFHLLRSEGNKDISDIKKVLKVKIGSDIYFVKLLEGEPVAVEQIIGGMISLYRLPSKLKLQRKLLFAEKGSLFKELKIYRRYITQSYYFEVAEYQSILSFFFRDCQNVTPVDKIPFTEDAIAREIYAYNLSCGQIRPVENETVKILFKDSTEKDAAIDTREFFQFKRLVTKDSLELPGIENVRSVSIGANTYFIKEFEGDAKIVEQVVSGTINFYRTASVLEEAGFFVEKGPIFKTLRIYRKGSREIAEYKSMLSFLFRDCQNLSVRVDRLNFNEQSIANVIRTYNATCGEASEVTQPSIKEVKSADSSLAKERPSKMKTEFAVLGGFAFASMQVTNSGRYGFISTFKMPLTRPFVGVSFHVSMGKLSGLGLKQSLTFEKINNKAVLNTPSGRDLTTQTLTYDFTELRYSPIVDYMIRTRGAIRFGIGAGGTFNFEFENKSKVSTIRYRDVNGVLQEYSRREIPYEGDSKKVRFSPVGELKIRYKRFEVVFQHLTIAHYQNDNGPSARENRVLVSWRITR
jgi:hypothetical protein